VDGVLFDHSGTTLLAFPPGKASSYNLASNVTRIADGAFYYCTSLASVGIPDSVTSIGNEAFYQCTSLAGISIPNSVTNLGDSSFAYSGLTSVTVGNGVTNLNTDAFAFCTRLKSVYFWGNAPGLSSGTFWDDDAATVYYLPGTSGWSSPFGGPLAVLWNPQAQTSDPSFGVRTNEFGFDITGSSNLVIVVEACTDLASPAWSPVSTNILNTFVGTNGTSRFSDPQWATYPSRFYRLRSP
jgi:hypothetical protein